MMNAERRVNMFVYSVKSSKLKYAALIGLGVVVIVSLLLFTRGDRPAAGDTTIRHAAATAEERQAFLSQFGWEVSADPIEVSEVIIPAEFDETYTKYNEIQLAQNFDLRNFSGRRVKRWTYEILNYPGYEGRAGVVQANLLIDRGVVIGGDICSLELGGFIHGFDFPQPAQLITAAETETTAALAFATSEPEAAVHAPMATTAPTTAVYAQPPPAAYDNPVAATDGKHN